MSEPSLICVFLAGATSQPARNTTPNATSAIARMSL